jgi:preprotein translocase subunit SecD
MGRKQIITLVAIVVLIIFSVCALAINNIFGRNGFTLGMDLKGGVYLEYQADFSGNSSASNADRLAGARDIIARRVNAWGISDAVVSTQGTDRIVVELPSYKDPEAAKQMVGTTAQLVFMEKATSGNTSVLAAANKGDTVISVESVTGFGVGDIFDIGFGFTKESQTIASIDEANMTFSVTPGFSFNHSVSEQITGNWTPATGLLDGVPTVLTGKYLLPKCVVMTNTVTNKPEVQFQWNTDGANLFSQITGNMIGKPLGIALDNEIISSPNVQAQISDTGVITGLTASEAFDLAIKLNAGALPLALHERAAYNVDPTLGKDTLNWSLLAGLIGLAMIVVFMTVYYRLPGLVSCIALLVYGAVILMIFKLLPVTLSAAGIAGVVISTGMAIDANILIFERTKEELRAGHALGPAIDMGFHRAWLAIRDGHISAIITCIILVWFGRSFNALSVTGFALTLGIGVTMSLFTAMIVTRSFMHIVMLAPVSKVKWLFHS